MFVKDVKTFENLEKVSNVLKWYIKCNPLEYQINYDMWYVNILFSWVYRFDFKPVVAKLLLAFTLSLYCRLKL